MDTAFGELSRVSVPFSNTNEYYRKQLACSYSPVTTYKESNITPNRGARPPLKSISSAIIVSAKLSPDQGEAETHWLVAPLVLFGITL